MYRVKYFYRKGIAAFVAAAFFLSGCAEKWEPKPLTMTQMIAGKEKKVWKFHSIEVIDEGEVDGPFSANEIYLPCSRDDEYIFYNNGDKTFEYTSGTIKCSPSDPDVFIDDAWSYTTANATLEFALPLALFGNIYILPFIVKKLTDTEMVLEIYFTKFYVEETDASYRVTLRSASSG